MTVEEFEEFYARSVQPLVGQVYLFTGDLHEAQDVVQEAFVRAWDRRARLDLGAGPEAWVRTVAVRLAISRWRGRGRAVEAWRRLSGAGPRELAAPGPDGVALVAALRRLSSRQRLVTVLHYVCDLPVDRIAAETGISPGTVKTHLSRARSALAPYLDAGADDIGADDSAPDDAPARTAPASGSPASGTSPHGTAALRKLSPGPGPGPEYPPAYRTSPPLAHTTLHQGAYRV
ncbi:SigE family RNA polymerase sigma factor [Streptomyces paludis]|uniref:SigE family RNA polymerase sigma factor n=1 Tax=Streptomyces paludis TaxID=2282738 RepID=A0A345HS24_9ACTN|nr:SigE family RNA polymerase sigma factor [Streptomyces paludis]